jgi:hypothetical protein
MKVFTVKVRETSYAYWEIKAETMDEALVRWSTGDLVSADDDFQSETVDVQEGELTSW